VQVQVQVQVLELEPVSVSDSMVWLEHSVMILAAKSRQAAASHCCCRPALLAIGAIAATN